MKIRWIITFFILNACIDPIGFDVPPPESLFVIEGMISDAPWPYTVRVSKALGLDSKSSYGSPVEHAKIELYDDEGNVETLSEASPGTYVTGGLIRGIVGRTYHIRVETPEGKVFESEPDVMNPVGEIQEITYEFEARSAVKSFGEIRADVFNIFVDAHAGTTDESYVRWRFTGTYKVDTNPELHAILPQGSTWLKDPLPCSGYEVAPAPGGGRLEKVRDCTCCTCWVNQYETLPQLSDVQLIANNQFRHVKVGEVPINSATFYEKYRVQVEQMSLSRRSFEFFRLVRAQREGAASLFQPPSAEIRGNIRASNSNDPVVGIFWATSIRSKSLFILPEHVPYLLPPPDFVTDACTSYYSNSTTYKPDFWE